MNEEALLSIISHAAAHRVSQLDLSYKEIHTLPAEIGILTELTSLDLRGNDLGTLPPAIGHLRNLQELDLRHNQLAALPTEFAKLTQLNHLDLRDNHLTALPAQFGQLTRLRFLDVRDNAFETFPTPILDLESLEQLHLWNNPFTSIPQKISRLTRLKVLNLGSSEMTSVPSGIWQLTNLEHLILDDTCVIRIPPDIAWLTKLKAIEMHSNRLTALPPEIGQLTELQALSLYNNALATLPPEIGQLQNLRRLDLRQNAITELPIAISELSKLEFLDLGGNPLPLPPEILARVHDPQVLITYYLEHRAGRKKPLNEAKMILVGQGSVGKTSLLKRLTRNDYDPLENRTEGIVIEPWQITVNRTPIQLNVWDFGGQEIMHATHQFFLTKRSLYLLVLDNRLGEEENRLEYWVKMIQSFGGEAPIIVVGNKADQQSLDIDQRGLQAKYPQIKAVVGTSCATGEGIDKLKAIIAREVARLPHIRDELLISWFNVKRKLETMDRDYLPYDTYVDMCRAEGIQDESSQRTLISFLHDLGIVLNFQDDPRLEDTNILNPEWVTNGVYRILNDECLLQKRGLLEHADLSRILDSRTYPRHKHRFILDMMRKFELCFAFESAQEERFLIPDLLSREAPSLGNWDDALAFQYHYNVLPHSIISRFIVRMHPYVHDNLYWRNGIVVSDQDCMALVRADREDKRVYIWVRGSEEGRRTLLSIIRSHFTTIHQTIPGIQAKEKVPLPGHPDIVTDYAYLQELREIGERSFVPPGLKQRVEVKALLDGVDLSPAQAEPVRLRQLLVEHMSIEELRTLCFDLGIDYDDLTGEGRAGKARELVAYLMRRGRLEDLIRMGKAQRPDVAWESAPASII